MDDRIAISRLKQGNLDGLETLVNRYQVQAVYAAYMIVFDRGLAEDVTQTAFIKAAERIHQFDQTHPFAPWFIRIVVNDALKLAKKQKHQVSLDEFDQPVTQLADWLADPSPQPEQMLEEKDMRKHILQAIQSLPPDRRAVIVMRYYLEMSEAEMSAKMERPLSTIKWWLRDARKRLSEMLDTRS